MGGVTNGWFVICVGDEVEDRSMVAHDKANGRLELQGLIRHDKLRDMKHLVPIK
jgi:hypothetical protein